VSELTSVPEVGQVVWVCERHYVVATSAPSDGGRRFVPMPCIDVDEQCEMTRDIYELDLGAEVCEGRRRPGFSAFDKPRTIHGLEDAVRLAAGLIWPPGASTCHRHRSAAPESVAALAPRAGEGARGLRRRAGHRWVKLVPGTTGSPLDRRHDLVSTSHHMAHSHYGARRFPWIATKNIQLRA
jgi:hypothetical protein